MRVPVTILTGFLGAGKTTLLNRLLQEGVRTAVIVNEFSALGIDNELIVSSDEDLVELSNGCICCNLNNDLRGAVERVLARAPEYLVVETTGLSDPLAVAMTFLQFFRASTRVDSIVTVADALSFCLEHFRDSQAARHQLVYGDVILLNKCDLVSSERLLELEASIRELNGRARILRSVRCEVPLPLILSVGLFQSDQVAVASPHLSADGFTSLSFESERPFAVHKLQSFLEGLPASVFRGKGLLWIEESPHRHVFHLVGKRFTLDSGPWAGPRSNKLVLIGQGIDQPGLLAQLSYCLT